MTNPFADVMRSINGYQVSQAMHVVAVLGIADLLAAGPRTSDDLAEATNTHAGTLYRVLRALAAAAVFHESSDRYFSLAPMGTCLRSDAVDPAAPWAAFIGRPYIWQAWSGLLHSVRTGETAFPAVHGSTVWEYRTKHPGEGAIFDAAMTALSRDVAAAVVATYDFSPFSSVVDVGGGQGALIGGILAANPTLQGVVFDQPHVVAGARPALQRLGVVERCVIAAGSFFEVVPRGDLLILKAILHDWEDNEAHAILRTCRRAVVAAGKLLVIERVLAKPNEGSDAKFADLNMLVGAGGRERSAEEFARLFEAAGFRLTGILPTSTRMAIVEADCV